VGKALTGGYLTLAATLCTPAVAEGIAADGSGVLMHGPTFMANPLACAVARASLALLEETGWAERVSRIEAQLSAELTPLSTHPAVADVRVLGAIGVVELHEPVELAAIGARFVERGVWIRPFGRLVYLMPPYVIEEADLRRLTSAVREVIGS
jgi:adenosylmethionine-8-amino-7-oxononanoate aminotransferase